MLARTNVQRCRFLALCNTAKTCDTDKLRAEISDFINSDMAAFKLQHQAAAMEQLSAKQNIEALQRKEDELQGQIQVRGGSLCIHINLRCLSI